MMLATCQKLALILLSLINVSTTTTRFSCPGQGYYPDPTSCTSFYRCVDLETSYKYLCPGGTRYDPAMRVCNHEALVPPCQIGIQTEPAEPTTRKPGTTPTNQKPLTKPNYTTPKPQTTTIRTTTRTTTTSAIEQDTLETDETEHAKDPVFPPALSTPIHAKSTPSSSSSPTLIVTSKSLPPRNYSVSPTSLYECSQPDYYEEETTCEQFYTCREIAEGVLAADRVFRCPGGYMFDTQTHLCQREDSVTCQKNKTEQFLFYTVLNSLLVQLKENELEQFFSKRLQLPLPRPKTVINPKVTLFGDDENPYPWVVFQSAIHWIDSQQ